MHFLMSLNEGVAIPESKVENIRAEGRFSLSNSVSVQTNVAEHIDTDGQNVECMLQTTKSIEFRLTAIYAAHEGAKVVLNSIAVNAEKLHYEISREIHPLLSSSLYKELEKDDRRRLNNVIAKYAGALTKVQEFENALAKIANIKVQDADAPSEFIISPLQETELKDNLRRWNRRMAKRLVPLENFGKAQSSVEEYQPIQMLMADERWNDEIMEYYGGIFSSLSVISV